MPEVKKDKIQENWRLGDTETAIPRTGGRKTASEKYEMSIYV